MFRSLGSSRNFQVRANLNEKGFMHLAVGLKIRGPRLPIFGSAPVLVVINRGAFPRQVISVSEGLKLKD